MDGQLYVADRQLLSATVVDMKPDLVIEVGTWLGGGSTLSLATALYANKKGKLYTIEMDKGFYNRAKESYLTEKPELVEYVEFVHGHSLQVYPKLLDKIASDLGTKKIIDIAFLDGCGTKSADGHKTALQELKLFERYFKTGGIFLMHDWNDAKAELVKPYITKSRKWKILTVLKRPDSIGLVKAKYLG